MPGWDDETWGYHGDDGGLFHGESDQMLARGNDLFGQGDVLGCYIDPFRRIAIFTKNGKVMRKWKEFFRSTAQKQANLMLVSCSIRL
jgi:hypothetical protein